MLFPLTVHFTMYPQTLSPDSFWHSVTQAPWNANGHCVLFPVVKYSLFSVGFKSEKKVDHESSRLGISFNCAEGYLCLTRLLSRLPMMKMHLLIRETDLSTSKVLLQII